MKLFEHRNFTIAKNELKAFMDQHSPGRIIIIIGVGGAGKTSLRHSVMREVYGNPMQWGLGKIPCIETMALLADKSYFSPKGFAESSLNNLFVPNLNWLQNDLLPMTSEVRQIIESVAKSKKIWEKVPRPKQAEPKTWEQFTNVANDRDLKLFSVEHASAFCANHRDKSPAEHIMNLMSVLEDFKGMGLLTTIQNGYKLWSSRSEIRRRCDIVWVPVYDVSKSDDRGCYMRLLKSICAPFEFEPKALPGKMAPDIAAVTGTVPGEIRNLFLRASNKAKLQGRSSITRKDIEASYYNDVDLTTLWNDIAEFKQAHESASRKTVSKIVGKIWIKNKKHEETECG